MQFKDNTRVSDHRKCNRYYYIRHIRHFVPDVTAPPLVFGSCWHASMDVVWKAIHEFPQLGSDEITELAYAEFVRMWMEDYALPHPDDLTEDQRETFKMRIPQTAFFMLGNYIQHRRAFIEKIELIAVEKPFAVPIFEDNPDVLYVGRLDKVVKWDGRIWVIEHKTTSWGGVKAGISGVYADSFSPNSQIDGYVHAAKMLYGPSAKGVMIDAAFVNKTFHDHFMFLPIERAVPHLDAWLSEVQHEIHLMELNDKTLNYDSSDSTFMRAYPKNTGSCIQFMRPCPYMDICKTISNPETDIIKTPLGFKTHKWEPFSVLGLEELGVKDESN